MRNYYESEVGHFKEAYCPDVATFKEALPVVKNKFSNKTQHKILINSEGDFTSIVSFNSSQEENNPNSKNDSI